jgi:hypothetical protein
MKAKNIKRKQNQPRSKSRKATRQQDTCDTKAKTGNTKAKRENESKTRKQKEEKNSPVRATPHFRAPPAAFSSRQDLKHFNF